MTSHKKRERTQNWTPEEKILLLKLCGHNINILESKKADQYSLTIKTNVWKDIHREFMSKIGTDRDILRLKEQWQRMKKQARSELQDYKLRSKNQNDAQQVRKISNISEEVLKIMQIAHRNNHEEEDISFSSSENSEQDNIPTYFCETEVKQELDDRDENEDQQKLLKDFVADDSEGSLSSLTAVINSQSRLQLTNINNKHETILNILTNICQTQQHNEAIENNSNNKSKRKINDAEEFQFLQSLFESKHKEHQKRMMIIDEQLKTAKLQRETAEIQKQIAQQELKHLLIQAGSSHPREKKISVSLFSPRENILRNNKEPFEENISDEVFHKIHFHQNQIKHHEDEIDKHKQNIEDIINREH